MVWLGGPDKNNGHFVFNQTNGGIDKNDAVTKIVYNNGCFYLTLADGTRLYFDKVQKGKSYTKFYYQDWTGDAQTVQTFTQKQIEPIAQQWLLTKVLYADYVDGDKDINDNPLSSSNNAGSWVVFDYEETVSVARTLPECVDGGINTASVAYNGNYLDDINLRWIRTPNQKAEYVYTDKRLDNLYFDEGKMQWWDEGDEGLRNRDPAAKICKNNSTGVLQPINRKVLDHVTIYNSDATAISTITFKTDYKLRPNSFHAYSKDNSGNYALPDATKNSNAASLTLESIEISGNGVKMPPTRFVYTNVNPIGFTQEVRKTRDNQPYATFYLENRDYWGYYCTGTEQDKFNAAGDEAFLQAAHAWSLERVIFPTGMQIQWEYEPNRYCKANNKSVTGKPSEENSAISLKTKFGGGIRMKKLTVINGYKEDKSYSFFYRNTFNDIYNYTDERDGISSGHVTADVCPYLLEQSADKRANEARGGNFTPAKVAYEKVQVVENYNSSSKATPLGYTGYTFVTNADPDCANTGLYGDGDNSWKRGMMKSKTVYDKKGLEILSTNWEYGFKYIGSTTEPLAEATPVRVELETSETNDACNVGWTYLKSITTSDHGVKKKQEFSYATDLNYTDETTTEKVKRIKKYWWEIGPSETYDGLYEPVLTSRRTSRKLRVLSYNGTNYFVMAMTKWNKDAASTMELFASPNFIGEDGLSNNHQSSRRVLDYYSLPNYNLIDYMNGLTPPPINLQNFIVNGLDLVDINNNGKPELLVQMTGRKNSGIDAIQMIYVFALKDFVFNNGVLEYSVAETDKFFYKEFAIGTYSYSPLCSAIGGIDNDGRPDLVYLMYNGNTKTVWIDAYMNITAELVPASTKRLELTNANGGIQGRFMALNGDPKMNDMVVTTPYVNGAASHYVLTDIDGNGALTCGVTTTIPDKISMQSPKIIDFIGADFVNNDLDYEICAVDKCVDEKFNATGLHERAELVSIKKAEVQLDRDGQPNISTVKPVTGTSFEPIVTVSTPAYLKFPAMLTDAHILTPSCQTITYKGPIANNKPVSSSVTKWQNFVTVGTKKVQWLPLCNYKWNVTMNELGETSKTPVYNFEDEKQNSPVEWALGDSIANVSSNGSVVETAKQGVGNTISRNYGSIVVGHKGLLPIANITNARFNECGVFTCDYDKADDTHGDYFDYENGWGKGAGNETNPPLPGPESRVCEEAKHFGNKGVKVTNAFGPTRAFKLEKGKDYIFSAWVKPIQIPTSNPTTVPLLNGMVIGIDYRICKSAEGVWPIELYPAPTAGADPSQVRTTLPCNSQLKYTQHGDWYYIELPVNAKTDIGDKWSDGYQYGAAWVGVPNGNGSHGDATVYIDDIRFYPKDALVTSTYYNDTLGLPIVTVDANNKPGRKVTYDNFGRPYLWTKIDPAKTFGDLGYETEIQRKEYHIAADLPTGKQILLLYPDGGEKFDKDEVVFIGWVQKNAGIVTIKYRTQSETSGNGTTLFSGNYPAGLNSYKWTVPDIQDFIGRVIGVFHSDASWDESDGTILIKTPPSPVVYTHPAIDGYYEMPITGGSLSWSCNDPDGDKLTYYIYLAEGTNDFPLPQKTDQNTINVGNLTYGREYRFKIAATDGRYTIEGPEWKFLTFEGKRRLIIKAQGIVQGGGLNSANCALNGTTWCYDCPELEERIVNNGYVSQYIVPGDPVTVQPTSSVNPLHCGMSTNNGYPAGYRKSIENWVLTDGTEGRITVPSGPVITFQMPDNDLVLKADYGTCQLETGNPPPNTPPYMPGNIAPVNGAGNVLINGTSLTWTGGDPNGGIVDYAIYIAQPGQSLTYVTTVSSTEQTITYSLGTLVYNSDYSWKIVASDRSNPPVESNVWTFHTTTESTQHHLIVWAKKEGAVDLGGRFCSSIEMGGNGCNTCENCPEHLNECLLEGDYTSGIPITVPITSRTPAVTPLRCGLVPDGPTGGGKKAIYTQIVNWHIKTGSVTITSINPLKFEMPSSDLVLEAVYGGCQ